MKFNNLDEMKKYYNKESNTYIFNGSVQFNFALSVNSHIKAAYIDAGNIDVWNINATDIRATDINARDINVSYIKARDIKAWDIHAMNIDAMDIRAMNIDAMDIDAKNINYHAVCFAYENIECESIIGRHHNSKHFCLDGELTIKEKQIKEVTMNELTELLGYEVKIKK